MFELWCLFNKKACSFSQTHCQSYTQIVEQVLANRENRLWFKRITNRQSFCMHRKSNASPIVLNASGIRRIFNCNSCIRNQTHSQSYYAHRKSNASSIVSLLCSNISYIVLCALRVKWIVNHVECITSQTHRQSCYEYRNSNASSVISQCTFISFQKCCQS